jgi:hypothetical protein
MTRKLTFGGRAFWLRQMRQWHWISAAVCLLGMLLFAATGITLNHASRIEASPQVFHLTAILPAALLSEAKQRPQSGKGVLPVAIADWISKEMSVRTLGREAEWSAQEIYVALPRPGGDAWLTVDLGNGETRYERTDRGWISYLNDLHKGRHTGLAWSLFLDIFAVACVVFCITGLVLLHLLSVGRPSTWPLVGFGIVVPALLAIFFIH